MQPGVTRSIRDQAAAQWPDGTVPILSASIIDMRDTDKIVNLRSDTDLMVGAQPHTARKNGMWATRALFDDDPVVVEPQDGLEAVEPESPSPDEARTPVTPGVHELSQDKAPDREVRNRRHAAKVESVSESGEPLHRQGPRRNDLTGPVIAIVGTTGAGKSSLIDALGGLDENGTRPSVGRDLKSCKQSFT
jgi:ABC-type glutathione transport system ATPase component